MKQHQETLEFHTIRQQLAELALSEGAKARLLTLEPSLHEVQCRRHMHETTEARKILDALGSPPLALTKELDALLQEVRMGALLSPEQLTSTAQFLSTCKRMKQYLKRAEYLQVDLAFYGGELRELDGLRSEIESCIRNGMVENSASPALHQVRRKLEHATAALKSKLSDLLRSKKEWFADGYITARSGRLVLPVKKEYRNQFNGTVVEVSGSGGTCFMEPAAVKKLQDEISSLQAAEEAEVQKVLGALTALVEEQLPELERNRSDMEALDFSFAKAKLSARMRAIPVPLTTDRRIVIRKGRHPLLQQDACVPLDFRVGGEYRGIVITGPNTGGKTVALKTVGLLSLMAQCGLHVPAAEGTSFCLHNAVLCDIGDGQSISENLSTFSAHMTRIIRIMDAMTEESLVLLDELGSGTDPTEGMGLAVSILEELKARGCLFVVTTHYPQVKEYAQNTPGLINARMAFDRDSLKPLYSLTIGEAGESCALHIASRLGLPAHMLQRAYAAAYPEEAKTEAPEPSQEAGTAQPNKPLGDSVGSRDGGAATTPTKNSPDANPGRSGKLPALVKESARPAAKPKEHRGHKFQVGDSVTVYPQKAVGIIFRRCDEQGMLGVQIQGRKQFVNHKRMKLLVPATELYPEDYDFSIVFDTVANRKARHQMTRKHQPGLTITQEDHP